ncbi:GGDEF domain-containing protein [Sphingomonas sp. HF-S4]|uniref:GGDEF domain-containing protein n=1 Tax=Sphingomonas agrestis TaxID=3080540 RepID=A0ABU3Y6M9_9SPHN|nr:GGDEF domain-containing protein [Sphingomonas sp. HF-S4]MDV3456833.1 GGDEF domain-containing protein [Sphingomonas sp. HF-S4]
MTLWLTNPGLAVPNDIRMALLSTLFGTLPIFAGGVLNTVAVAALVSFRQPGPLFQFWLWLELALCAVRLVVLVLSLKAAKAGRKTPTDLYLCLAVLWAASVGYGCCVTIASADWVASTLACLSAAAMVGGICFRNFGAPRLVAVMIALSLGPCAIASLLSGQLILLVVAAQIPFYLIAMTKASYRLNQILITTMQAERDNDRRARHDGLTGLVNRMGLQRAFEQRRATGGSLGLLYLDLDGFKSINDTLGHAAGDFLLVQVADRLRSAADGDAVLSRIGGDEFIALVPADDAQAAYRAAGAIASALRHRPFLVAGASVNLAGSVGVAFGRYGEQSLAQLMQQADIALYQAKSAGGGVRLGDQPEALEHKPDWVTNAASGFNLAA